MIIIVTARFRATALIQCYDILVQLNNCLKANELNKSVAKVSGKRKREVVLVFWLFQQNSNL